VPGLIGWDRNLLTFCLGWPLSAILPFALSEYLGFQVWATPLSLIFSLKKNKNNELTQDNCTYLWGTMWGFSAYIQCAIITLNLYHFSVLGAVKLLSESAVPEGSRSLPPGQVHLCPFATLGESLSQSLWEIPRESLCLWHMCGFKNYPLICYIGT
jgi:hypothetical protein